MRNLSILALATVIAGGAAAAPVMIDTRFEPRAVTQIEVGDFHFRPGQVAPVHTHQAPAFGYVSKGSILYHVEGQKPVILKAGDTFFEPVGPRILTFDNASNTEEAVFTDFNPERAGDPFIVFEKPPTEKIDRRSFPTVAATGSTVSRVMARSVALNGKGRTLTAGPAPLTGYVASGSLTVTVAGTSTAYPAGASFAVPAGATASLSGRGRAITFTLSR